MSGLSINLIQNKNYPLTQCATKFINTFGSNLTVGKGRIVGATTGALQKDLAPVIGITLWTPQKKFVACSTPGCETLVSLPRRIGSSVDKLREDLKHSYEEVLAVITGGIAYSSNHPKAEESVKIIDIIKNILNKKEVETSVIAEQFADSKTARMNTYSIANNLTLWGEPVNYSKLSVNQKADSIENALSEEFDYVEFSKYIPISVIDKFPWSAENKIKK